VTAVAGATPVRSEDAFDVPAAVEWLRGNAAGEYAGRLGGVPEVLQFAGGASNLTYLLRFDGLDLVLRRGPSGTKARGAHDMGREYRIQSALRTQFPYVATMVAFCDDPGVIGSEFYVMERLVGIVPRRDLQVPVSPEQARALCHGMLDVLVRLHTVDPAEAGLETLGKGDGYVRRQVEGWSARYRAAVTDGQPDLESTMAWLDEHQPADVGSCVIHNDFKFDNLVLDPGDPTRILGLFDWEMATVGDPLMDLGAAMAYWVDADDDPDFQQFRRVPTNHAGMLTRAEMVAGYAERRGFDLTPEQALFYEAYGLFRLAVIAQQIFYRYALGQTTNESYAVFGPAVQILDRRLRRLLGQA
jgi:aminoglycoside phosphotransferase (APT) family kinase protein